MCAHLVSQSLRSDDCNFVAYSLVGLEVESELGVVSLDDDLGGLLDGLGSDTTHVCECVEEMCRAYGSRSC